MKYTEKKSKCDKEFVFFRIQLPTLLKTLFNQ